MADEITRRLNPRVLQGSGPDHWRVKLHRLLPEERLALSGRDILRGTASELLACPDAFRPSIEEALHNYSRPSFRLKLPGGSLEMGDRTLIMGILNVTPDSFYDGGRYADTVSAIEHGLRMAQEGADVVDVGGESTRPGSSPVPEDEQIRRVVPVVRGLASRRIRVSVDTSLAPVAEAALEAGASIVNDITGLTGDERMIPAARKAGAAVVVMHIQGTPRTMQQSPQYADVMEEVTGTLRDWTRRALDRGIDSDRIVIDPGLGFGKRFEDNLEIVAHLAEFRSLGFPLLIGASRKSFVGTLVGSSNPEGRLGGSLAVAAHAAMNGARILRVHDVRETRDVLAAIDRVRAA